MASAKSKKMENFNTSKFDVSYGTFSKSLTYGDLNLQIKLAHRKIVGLKLGEIYFIVGCITGTTPSTYYSGNREYGRYLFFLPEGIRVKKTEYDGDSNADAENRNKSTLRLPAHGACSIGFDFYQVSSVAYEGQYMEISEKIEGELKFAEFNSLLKEEFIKNAFPYNLPELIPGFNHQTSGWKRNKGETHLHAVTEINGISCFIMFASSEAEIPLIEGISTQYLKQAVLDDGV